MNFNRAVYHYNLLKVIAVAEACGKLDPPKQERKYWVHPINSDREESNKFNIFYENIRCYSEKFFEYYRMSISSFDELLEKIRPFITKQNTTFRNVISPEERLTITLRFLSVGLNFVALKYEFSLGRSTVSKIIKETCEVIWNILQPTEMPEPSSEQWRDIADKFYTKTQFPNCVGAVDGKHIRCVNPKNSGSIYFNYKKFFSIVLMAVVDAEYCFISIDVGAYGREGDSTVFKECPFGKRLYSEQLGLPAPVCLPNTSDNNPQPYVVIGDEAFGLHKNLLRPFPGRAINVEPDFADIIVKACCLLRNFVRRRDGVNFEDTLSNSLDDLDVHQNDSGGRSQGRDVRDYFANYFLEAGSVPFQYRFV
ncbi:uncharacterized protein LOC107884489 [Acyrthosiphon pisum]|uniref:DDE Tnp4 domain-containing protein n=1 Tax=Acyrthosiphon pisum TaxID=7029 RepID=A0A8R2H7U3_ACYPI|nr:uncharacterized protein LOC107884489 [Acyrthosiphon pisum]|eukprot:XP_016662197.1 PREDICTED: uncharacterized protein LOC107884489 [Acyrthosiphon pisum]